MLTPFLSIFEIVPGWVWAAICAAFMLTTCAERSAHQTTQLTFAKARADWAKTEAAQERIARQASENYRAKEAQWAANLKEVEDVLRTERQAVDELVRRSVATRSVLVSSTFAVSARSGAATDPTAALRRAEDTAEAFGQLLVRCDAVAEGLGRDAEALAAQVRALIAADRAISDPVPDRRQVDPSPPLPRDGVVRSALPDPSTQPSLDAQASL